MRARNFAKFEPPRAPWELSANFEPPRALQELGKLEPLRGLHEMGKH